MARKKKETGPVVVSKYVDKKFGKYPDLMAILRELTLGGAPIDRAPTGIIIGYKQWWRHGDPGAYPHHVKLHTHQGVWRIIYGPDRWKRAMVNINDPSEAVPYIEKWVLENNPPPPGGHEKAVRKIP